MLKYKIVSRKNPMNKSVKWYASIATPMPVTLNELAENIEKSSTVSRADAKAVIDALQYAIKKALLDGKSVRLGDLGSFRVTLGSSGAFSEKEFQTSMIKRVRVQFQPSTELRNAFAVSSANPSLKFQRVTVKQDEVIEEGGV